MTDKTKLKFNSTSPFLRYSQKSSNSTENSDLDYNFYCYSQGYKNLEKGYWRGVLRNKNVDFDLRFNKEWNRRIELENDDYDQSNYSTKKGELQLTGFDKFSKDYIALINDSEIGWNSDRFKNFQIFQHQNGIKKQKNKEWILSNGIKRKDMGMESNLQNYTQNDTNKLKYLKDTSKKGFTDWKNINSNLSQSLQISDIKNKNISGSNTYKKPSNIKGIETSSGSKSYLDYGKKNLQTEYNYDKNNFGKIGKNISSINTGKDKSYDTSRVRQIEGNKGNKISIDQSYDWYRNISPISKLNPKSTKITNGFGASYPDKKQPQKKEKLEFKYGQNINRTTSYDDNKNSLSYIGKLNESKNKKETIEKETTDKYGRPSTMRRFDDKYEQQKRTHSYDNQGKGKNEPKKGYGNIDSNYLNTDKKVPKDNKYYDKQKPKIDTLTYQKSTYDRKQQQPLKKDTTPYDKKKFLQDQKTAHDRTSYDPKKIGIQPKGKMPQAKAPKYDKTPQGKKKLQNQPSMKSAYDQSSLKPQIKNTPYDISSYKNGKQQINIKKQLYGLDNITPYNTNKLLNSLQTSTSTYNKNTLSQSQGQTLQTQSREIQSIFEKNQTAYGQKRPISKYDIKKYTSLTNTELKTRGKDGENRPSYVKRFDFDDKTDKEIKLKDYKKPTSSYDKKKPKIKGELLIFEKRLERPDNLVRLEVSVERKRTDSEKATRTPGVREHQRIYSSKKKKKQVYDSEGKPLTNTRRLNDSAEKKSKKPEGQRLPNYSRLETSEDKKKNDYRPVRETSPRENERINSNKKDRKPNYDSQGRPISNAERLNVSAEKNKEYVKKLDFNENINKNKYNIPQKTKTETGKLKTKPISNIYLQKGLKTDNQKPSNDIYNQSQKEKPKDKDINKQYTIYQKPKEQKSFTQYNQQKTDYNKPSSNYNNYPSLITQKKQPKLIKTQTQTQLKPKKYQFNQDYEQKSKTNISGYQKPQKYGKGIAPDYQQYSLVSQTQPQKGLNKKVDTSSTYGSNLNTAATKNKMSKPDRMNKSFDGPRFGDKPYINISDNNYGSNLPNKNKYLQTQQTQQPKKAEMNLTPFSQNSNLSTSKILLSKLAKYYRPIKDNKNKYDTPGQGSSSLSKKTKSSDKYLPQKTSKDNNVPKKGFPEQEKQIETRYNQYLKPLTGRKKNDQYNKKTQPSQKLLSKTKSEYPSLIKGKTAYDLKPKNIYEQKEQKNYDSITGISKYKTKTYFQQKGKNQPYGTTKKENDKYSIYQTDLQKNNLGQPLKPMKTIASVYQLKTDQKDKYNMPKFSVGETNEYNPYSKNNLYEYKPSTTLVNKKNSEKKGILSQSTDDYRYPKSGSKKGADSFAKKTFNNSYINPGSNKYSSAMDKSKKYDSSSYLNDKNASYTDINKTKKSKGDKNRNSLYSEDKTMDGQRNRNNKNNLYNLYGMSTPNQRDSMYYFKLQFLTTKEVCEKFWKSIDKGELPISMFDSKRNYGMGSSDRNNSFKF